MDQVGNLYGTACGNDCGTAGNAGTVFRLSKNGSGWIFNPLYIFAGGNNGANPHAGVVLGPHNILYGTTPYVGGSGCGSSCGTVFSLKPLPSACKSALCFWAETVLYGFTGGTDGAAPAFGDVVFDGAGDLYGTTQFGGTFSSGTVFELTPSGSGWKENILYSFTGGSDGGFPYAGVILDKAGNLYGTASSGGANGVGTVFELTPSGSGWTANTLYSFTDSSDGGYPYGGLTFDQSGALYGATISGGQAGGGTVFKLTPSGDTWTYSLVYSFNGPGGAYCGPTANLITDGAGNLYGTTLCDGGFGKGSVFKLTPSGGNWTYISLHDFGGFSDGANPVGPVMLDANGNLYGTAAYAGGSGLGVAFEITP
jgi:uncharacterized repeat protein (TIGR03803 family)